MPAYFAHEFSHKDLQKAMSRIVTIAIREEKKMNPIFATKLT